VNAWLNVSKAYNESTVDLPATAILVAQHNMVTETISDTFIGDGRKKFFCPADVLAGVKAGLLSLNAQVTAFTLPTYAPVAGVPGLASSHASISCV